ncbi:MAG TPA: hypothetical protein PLV76_03965, partial [Spirochaetales bacterium]|nr:hypothetical protein [Spirochaetales bacterium]
MNTSIEKKVYDYKPDAVRSTIVQALRKKHGEATVADVIAATGLPKYQVETEMPALVDEYNGRLRVTDSGEILFSFPHGFTSRYRGLGVTLKKIFSAVKKGVKAIAVFLFKAWIMVMLVGYFVFFVALALLAVFASFAGSSSSRRDNRSSSSGAGGFLAVRVIELIVRIWFYSELFKTPEERASDYYRRQEAKRNSRPLHKAIFSFVFGEPDVNKDHDVLLKKIFVAMVRMKKGIITIEDFIALTGLSPESAEQAICRYLYEFEGSPEVSEDGTLYYDFSKLLVRLDTEKSINTVSAFKKLQPFSGNNKKSNTTFAVINGVNLIFGSYFLFQALQYDPAMIKTEFSYFFYFTFKLFASFGVENPLAVITWVLGAVPFVFSLLFWIVPAVRSLLLKHSNEAIKVENARRYVYTQLAHAPIELDESIFNDAPVFAVPDSQNIKKVLMETAVYEKADVSENGKYILTDYGRRYKDIESLR